MCTGNYSTQVAYIVIGLAGLSKAVSDQQFYDMTEEIPELNNVFAWMPWLLYYYMHVGMRLASYAFLCAHYLYYATMMLPVQVLVNFGIERYACQEKELSGNMGTAFLSLVAPAAGGIETGSGDEIHRKFCRWHCIAFALNLALATTVLNLLSFLEVIKIKKPPYSASASLGLEPLHPNVMGWGGLSVIAVTVLFSFLSGIFAYWRCTCCHELQRPFDNKLQEMKTALTCKNSDQTLPDGNETEMQKINPG